MRVLLLGPCPPPEGGVSRNLFDIRDRLLSEGYQCSVISITRTESQKDEPNIFYPRTTIEFIRLLRNLDFDLLHLHVGGRIPRRVLGLMFVCAIHGRSRSVLTLHSGGFALEAVKNANKLTISGKVFRMFERIICVNTLMVEMFERFGVRSERLKVIPPFSFETPVPSTTLPRSLEERCEKYDPLLLTVGQLEKEYDIESQVEALSSVLTQFPKVGLIVVGSGSEASNLQDLIASKGLSEKIYLAGNVEHRHALKLITKAAVVLRTTKYDGDAISIREALNVGTPVVATQNEMRPEGVELIRLPANADELAAKVKEVVTRGDRPPSVSFGSGKDNLDAVLDLYKEIIEGRCLKP